jgi:hypothetical protein
MLRASDSYHTLLSYHNNECMAADEATTAISAVFLVAGVSAELAVQLSSMRVVLRLLVQYAVFAIVITASIIALHVSSQSVRQTRASAGTACCGICWCHYAATL